MRHGDFRALIAAIVVAAAFTICMLVAAYGSLDPVELAFLAFLTGAVSIGAASNTLRG